MDEGKCLMSGPGHRGRQESIPLVGYLGVWIFFLLWSETTGSLGLVFFFGGGGFLGFIFNNFIDIQVTEHVIKKKTQFSGFWLFTILCSSHQNQFWNIFITFKRDIRLLSHHLPISLSTFSSPLALGNH